MPFLCISFFHTNISLYFDISFRRQPCFLRVRRQADLAPTFISIRLAAAS
jgi:hypothetical protein